MPAGYCGRMDPMPNRLAHETSPYLLQHADNPVDWWPWSKGAFEGCPLLRRPQMGRAPFW